MSLPSSYKQQITSIPSQAQNQLLRARTPVTFNILQERLKASGTGIGGNSKDSQNQSPFVSSPYGNPGFHLQKLGKGTSSEGRIPKPPKPPEKPLMPYMRYSRKVWDQVKAQNPELKLWEIGKIIGQMWRDLPSENKTEFMEDYEAEKVEYEKNLKLYYNSPAYLAYMSSKNKGKTQQSGDDRETYDRSSGGGKHDKKIEIQPAEDEDDADEVYSVKHISYARYTRNHHLMNEIFSDSVVPDLRSIVTTSRMQNYYWKIQSLKAHQKKMESEVQQLVEKFEATKRKFSEASDAFQEEIRKYCKRAVDDEFFNSMVDKEYERLRKERSANNNPSVDELKKDVGRDSSHGLLHLASDPVPTVPLYTSNAEQSSSEKHGNPVNSTSEEECLCIPTIVAVDEPVGTVQSGYHQTNVNPIAGSGVGGYSQCSPQTPLNRMPPPLLQPSFTQRPLFPNTRPQYSHPGGFPQYNTHQPPQTYYPSSYQCQTQGISMPRPALPFGPSLDSQTSISLDLMIDKDDIFGAI